jgi:hypothetical protein
MDKKREAPKNYDRWDKTCVKFTDAPKKKVVKKVKRGK